MIDNYQTSITKSLFLKKYAFRIAILMPAASYGRRNNITKMMSERLPDVVDYAIRSYGHHAFLYLKTEADATAVLTEARNEGMMIDEFTRPRHEADLAALFERKIIRKTLFFGCYRYRFELNYGSSELVDEFMSAHFDFDFDKYKIEIKTSFYVFLSEPVYEIRFKTDRVFYDGYGRGRRLFVADGDDAALIRLGLSDQVRRITTCVTRAELDET